jgi:hypothetical protein
MRAAGKHLMGKRSSVSDKTLANVRLERATREQRAKLVQCRASGADRPTTLKSALRPQRLWP